MSKEEKKRILTDKWPEAPRGYKKALLEALKKAPKQGLFEARKEEELLTR